MSTSNHLTARVAACCLALASCVAFAQGSGAGGGSGAPNNNPPGVPKNNAGNPVGGGTPSADATAASGPKMKRPMRAKKSPMAASAASASMK